MLHLEKQGRKRPLDMQDKVDFKPVQCCLLEGARIGKIIYRAGAVEPKYREPALVIKTPKNGSQEPAFF